MSERNKDNILLPRRLGNIMIKHLKTKLMKHYDVIRCMDLLSTGENHREEPPYTTPRNKAVGIMGRVSDFRSRVSLDRTMPPPTCLRRYLPFSDVILP